MSNIKRYAAVLFCRAMETPLPGRAPLAALTLPALVLAAVALPAVPAGAETSVTGVRVGHHRGFTRLTLSLTAPVRFRATTAGAPYRLIVEMDSVDWQLTPIVTLGGGLIAALRYETHEGRVRVVASLRGPAKVQKTFALRPRKGRTWRLVVDLERISRDAFDRIHGKRKSRTPDKAIARLAPSARSDAPRDAPRDAKTGASKAVQADKANAKESAVAVVAGPADGPLIVLDPGHGGQDAGAISPWGLQEKVVALAFARTLRRALLNKARFRVQLTRDSDRFLPLRRRYEIARKAKASLFVSIHADANPFKRMRGLSVYTLSVRASDRLAAAMAHRENRADLIAGVNLEDKSDPVSGILIDLVRRETMARSVRIAGLIVQEGRKVTELLHKPRRSAGFAVLKAPDVPSILIELGVLTNKADETKLRDPAHHRRVAAALVRAFDRFFARNRRVPQTAAGERERRN